MLGILASAESKQLLSIEPLLHENISLMHCTHGNRILLNRQMGLTNSCRWSMRAVEGQKTGGGGSERVGE